MYRKNCYKCRRPSFSSGKKGVWICPVCGADLSEFKATEAHIWGERHSIQHIERRNVKKFYI